MIHDEFTSLKVSRQRKWQMRQKVAGLCILCAEKSVNGIHCENHRQDNHDRGRAFKGCKRIYRRQWEDGVKRKSMSEQCYELRSKGLSWKEVAKTLERSLAYVMGAATYWANTRDLPKP